MSVIANLLGYDTVISKSQVLKAEVIAFVKTVSIDCFVFLLLLVDIVNLFRSSCSFQSFKRPFVCFGLDWYC